MTRLPPELRGFEATLYNLIPWIAKLIVLLGISVVVWLAICADCSWWTVIGAAFGFLVLLFVLAELDRRVESRVSKRVAKWREGQSQDHDNDEDATDSDLDSASGEHRRGNDLIFAASDIEGDESIPEADFEDDTLCDDTTGHGVDLEDGLFECGVGSAVELLELPEDEWSMRPWGYEVFLGIEAIAAAAGEPSRSRQLARLRTWGKRVEFQPNSEMVERMLGLIDYYLDEIAANPEKRDVHPEYVEEVKSVGAAMRKRISRLSK